MNELIQVRPDHSADLAAAQVAALVHGHRFPLRYEKDAQAALAHVMEKAGIAFEREVRLSDEDIPDFMVGGLAIELKLRGGKMDVYRQLKRYAAHERVTRLLLVTNLAMGLPEEIEGRKTYIASLGRAWL